MRRRIGEAVLPLIEWGVVVSAATIRAIPSHPGTALRAGGALLGHVFLVVLAGICYTFGYIAGLLLRLVLWCVASFIAGFQVGRK